MNKLLEIFGLVSVAVAGLWAAIKAGLIRVQSSPYAVDPKVLEDVEKIEDIHGEKVEQIAAEAEVVRSADSAELASEFDKSFGTVPKLNPFEKREDN